MAEETVTSTEEVQSAVLTEEEAQQVVSGEEGEEVTLPSEQEEFTVPEKFQGKSLEDVVKAYIELEKMKGGGPEVSQEGEEPSQEVPSEEKSDDKSDEDIKDNVDVSKFEEKYLKEGSLSEEDYAELEKLGYNKQVVDEHIEYVEWKREKAINEVLSPIGLDKETFKEMTTWLAQTKAPEEINEINAALASAPKVAQQALIKGLYAEYKAGGNPDVIHTNSKQTQPSKGYQTQEEFFKDVGSPEYQNNPKFRAKVEAKMAMSDIF
jgi:hypothetical protein